MSVSIVIVIVIYHWWRTRTDFVYIKFVSSNSIFYCVVTMFGINNLWTVFHVQTVSTFMTYVCTTLHFPSCIDTLVVAVTLRTREILCVCHVLSWLQVRIKEHNGHIWLEQTDKSAVVQHDERDHWGDLGIDGWIILGWISRRWDVGIWTGLDWPRIGKGGGRLWVR